MAPVFSRTLVGVCALFSIVASQNDTDTGAPTCTEAADCDPFLEAMGYGGLIAACTGGYCDIPSCNATMSCPSGFCNDYMEICLKSCNDYATACEVNPLVSCDSTSGECVMRNCTSVDDCPNADDYLCYGFCVRKCTVVDYCDSDTEYCDADLGYCTEYTCDMVPDPESFCMNQTASTEYRVCETDSDGEGYCARQSCSATADCMTDEVCGSDMECVADCNTLGSWYCAAMNGPISVCGSSGECEDLTCTADGDCTLVLGDEYVCDVDTGVCDFGCSGNDTLCEQEFLDSDPYAMELICSDTNVCIRTPCDTTDATACQEMGNFVCYEGECIEACYADWYCEDRFGDLGTCDTTGFCGLWCDASLAVNSGVDQCSQYSSAVGVELYCDTDVEMDCTPMSCSADSDCSLEGASCMALPDIGPICYVPCTSNEECVTRFTLFGEQTDAFCGQTGICMPVEETCTTSDDCESGVQFCNEAGACETIICVDDASDAVCQTAFDNELAYCYTNSTDVEFSFCVSPQCLADEDCTGKFDSCATFVEPPECYTSCTGNADCAAAYGIDTIMCETLPANSSVGNPQEIMVCDIFGIGNFTYNGTFNPTAAPTREPTAGPTAEPTEAIIASTMEAASTMAVTSTMATTEDTSDENNPSGVDTYGVMMALATIMAACSWM